MTTEIRVLEAHEFGKASGMTAHGRLERRQTFITEFPSQIRTERVEIEFGRLQSGIVDTREIATPRHRQRECQQPRFEQGELGRSVVAQRQVDTDIHLATVAHRDEICRGDLWPTHQCPPRRSTPTMSSSNSAHSPIIRRRRARSASARFEATVPSARPRRSAISRCLSASSCRNRSSSR